jgi:hypothetical protein
MAALVLGLLIASANESYGAQKNELIAVAAKIGLIDRGLALYGPDAQTSRDLLRGDLDIAVKQLWSKGHHSPRRIPGCRDCSGSALRKHSAARSPERHATGNLKLRRWRWCCSLRNSVS